MAFLSSFDICASGMSAQRVRMDIAAENIANIDTTRTEAGGPYRRKDVMFESYGAGSFQEALISASQGKGFASRNAGVRVSGIVEDDREMKRVDSMSATRSYEANVTALNAMKLMVQKALEIGK